MQDGVGNYSQSQRNAFAALRIAFGVVWLLNTWFQAHGVYLDHLVSIISTGEAGEPLWMQDYLQWFVHGIVAIGPHAVAVGTAAIDALLALSLLTGVWTRPLAWAGIVYSLLMWSVVEAFGGPYGPGATDPGPGIVYALGFVFVLLTRAWETWSLASRSGPARPAAAGSREGASQLDPLRAGRLLFGLLWAFDAAWKWQPYFLTHVIGLIQAGQQGEPAWIAAYVQFFVAIISVVGPIAFGLFTACLETLLAFGLLTGLWLRLLIPLGAIFSLGIWTTAEDWGGPYTLTSTGMPGDVIGNAILYVYIFLYLWVAYGPRRERRIEDRPERNRRVDEGAGYRGLPPASA